MAQKIFTFWVRNDSTNETLRMSGQGETVADAWKDANNLATTPPDPVADGRQRPPGGQHGVPLCNVRNKDGEYIPRTFKAWETSTRQNYVNN